MSEAHEGGAPAPEAATAADRPVDVFISYSSQDRDKVEKLAHALEKSGFNVWWDRALLPGDSYEGSIEVALKEAKAVIVCWTHNAIASDWVRSEADDARVNGKLLPIFMEEVDLPKPFDRIHTENLIGWWGNRDHHAFQELEEAVRARVEGRAAKTIPWRRKWITRGALVSLVAMIGIGAANVSLVRDIFFPQETLTASQVEQIVAAALAQAGQQGVDLDDRGQENLRDALSAVLKSTDSDKATAREALMQGRVEDAAASLADVAKRQAEAAGGAIDAAAESYREAGALYSASDTGAAIDAYRESLRLAPGDPDAMNGLAHLLERTGQVAEARDIYTEVLNTTGQTEPIWKAKMLGNLGLMADASGDHAGAEENIKAAMEIFKAEGDEVAVAKALINLGQVSQADERWDVAKDYTERGIRLSKRIGLPRGEATGLANLGYQEMMLENFDEARALFDQSKAVMEAEGMKVEMGYIYINLARMLHIEGKEDEAEAMAEKALQVANEMNAKLLEGGAYNHLGNVARERGNFDEAELYQAKAIRIFEEIEAPLRLEQQYRAYGMTAEAKGDFDTAIARYQKAEDAVAHLDAPRVKADLKLSLARLNASAERYEEAVALTEQAVDIYASQSDPKGVGDAIFMQARVKRAAGDLQAAVNAFDLASVNYLEAGEALLSADSKLAISDIAFQVGNPMIARLALDEAIAVLPEDAPLQVVTYASVSWAEAHMMTNEPDAAFQIAQENLERLNASPDAPPEWRVDANMLLGRFHRAVGQEEEAKAFMTEAAAILREAGGPLADNAAQIEAERDAGPQ